MIPTPAALLWEKFSWNFKQVALYTSEYPLLPYIPELPRLTESSQVLVQPWHPSLVDTVQCSLLASWLGQWHHSLLESCRWVQASQYAYIWQWTEPLCVPISKLTSDKSSRNCFILCCSVGITLRSVEKTQWVAHQGVSLTLPHSCYCG